MIPASWTGSVALVYGQWRRVAACASCKRVRPLECRGLCYRCRDRHQKAGTLGQFGYVKADRLADFAGLREQGYPPEVAAVRLGVSTRTGWRYEAELRTAA